jgi:hypothetical protein
MKDKILKFFTYILAIVGILAVVAVLLWGVVAVHSKTLIPRGIVVGYIKGVWLPDPIDWWHVYNDIDELRENGVNTISIGAYSPNHMMSIFIQPFVAQLVKKAHNNDMAVHLVVNSWGPGFDTSVKHPEMEEHLTDEAIYWAKFARKYHIEYFSPQNEPDVILGNQEAAAWAQEILPEIRDLYKGEIIHKIGKFIPDQDTLGAYPVQLSTYSADGVTSQDYSLYFSDATGYDYLMIDVYPSDMMQDNNLFMSDLNQILNAANQEVTAKNLKGLMIGEFGYAIEKRGEEADITPGPVITPAEQATYLGQYIETAKPKVDGLIHCGWNRTGYRIKEQPAEEILKEKFTQE